MPESMFLYVLGISAINLTTKLKDYIYCIWKYNQETHLKKKKTL